MALGVLNNLSAIYAENNLNSTSNSLQTVLQQLSSGSRINSGADDAAGLSLVNGLQANSTALTQSATNASEGVGLLRVADGALSQVTNLLNRAITLATEASNGTLNASQEAAANQEYTSILSEVNNIGSTTTYNQQAVFGGNTVSIYTGDASPTGSSIDSLYIRTLSSASVGDTGGAMSYSNGQDNVFIDLSKGGINAGVSDSLNGGTNGSTTISVNYLAKGSSGSVTNATANITVGSGTNYANTAQGLISAINDSGLGLSATFATAAQAGSVAMSAAGAANALGGGSTDTGIEISGIGVGTGTNGAGEVGTLTVGASGDLLGGTLTVVGSDGKSHNILLGSANSTDSVANLAATINAAGYGVTASVNSGIVDGHAVGTVLTFSADSAAVSVSGTSLTDNAAATALTAVPTQSAQFNSTIGSLTATAVGGNLDGVLNFGSIAVTLGTPGTTQTMAQLLSTINNSNYGVTASYDSTTGVMTFASANSALTFSGSNLTDVGGTLTSTTAVANHSQIGTLSLPAVSNPGDTLTNGQKLIVNGVTFTTSAAMNTMALLTAAVNAANLGVTATENMTTGAITFVSTNPSTEGVTISTNIVDLSAGGALNAITDTPSTDNSQYYSVGISGSILDTSTNGGTLNTGMVSDSDGTDGIATVSYTDGEGADLSTSDLLTQVHAQAALTALNQAITDVAAMDGYIGAQINTLNSVTQVINTQQENVVSAQNAIQATDYASATSNMSKYEILSQTGIAALAQANSVQQEVTKLLQ